MVEGTAGFFATFDLVFDFFEGRSGSRLLDVVHDQPGTRAFPQALQLSGIVCDDDSLDGWACEARKAEICGDVDRSIFEAAWRCL